MWMRAGPRRSFFFIEKKKKKKGAFLNILLRDKVSYKAIFTSLLPHYIPRGRCIELHSTLRLTRQVFQAPILVFCYRLSQDILWCQVAPVALVRQLHGWRNASAKGSIVPAPTKDAGFSISLVWQSTRREGCEALLSWILSPSWKGPSGALSWPPAPALGGRTRQVRDSAETQASDSHQCAFLPRLTHWVPLETADLTWF